MTENKFISSTKKWVTSFIIHHNICPFAKTEYDKGSIHFELVEAINLKINSKHLFLPALNLMRSQILKQP